MTGPRYITVEGNKRISIYKKDDNQAVAVEYVDLDVLGRIKKRLRIQDDIELEPESYFAFWLHQINDFKYK